MYILIEEYIWFNDINDGNGYSVGDENGSGRGDGENDICGYSFWCSASNGNGYSKSC